MYLPILSCFSLMGGSVGRAQLSAPPSAAIQTVKDTLMGMSLGNAPMPSCALSWLSCSNTRANDESCVCWVLDGPNLRLFGAGSEFTSGLVLSKHIYEQGPLRDCLQSSPGARQWLILPFGNRRASHVVASQQYNLCERSG
jgi:hypothetical protein